MPLKEIEITILIRATVPEEYDSGYVTSQTLRAARLGLDTQSEFRTSYRTVDLHRVEVRHFPEETEKP